jgi:ABC-type Fe3+-hydroxamate transport system substrate-binding protein
MPNDVFLLCDSAGKCLDQKSLKDAKKTGANEYQTKFTKVPKDAKDLTIKIEDKEKRVVIINKEKVSLEE